MLANTFKGNKFLLKLLAIIAFCFVQLFSVKAQSPSLDSLKDLLQKEKNLEKQVNLKSLIGEYGSIERPTYWDSIVSDAKKINYFHGIVYASFMQSICYTKTGNYDKAVTYAEQSLEYSKKDKDTVWMGYSVEHLGSLNAYIDEKETALNYYKEAQNLYNAKKLAWRRGYVSIRIGEMNEEDKAYSISMQLYKKSLREFLETNDSSGISLAYSKIGKLYHIQNQRDSALSYLLISLACRKNVTDEYYLCNILNDIAFLYLELGDEEKAFQYIKESDKEAERINEKGMAYRDINTLYYKYYKAKNNFQLSLHYKEISDSLDKVVNSEGNGKAVLRQQAKHMYDKQKELDTIEHEKHIAIEKEEKEKQQIVIYSICFGLLLVLVFSVVIYKRFKLTQKQKYIIEEKEKETQIQKHLIEEKHKEITDSINYAERIQRSFLATKEMLDARLKDYFILFKPKDVVSGDFYWATILNNNKFALVTADSTGHGVPGAIMSLLNITGLEKAIEHHNEPAEILNTTRKIIIERLKKDGSAEGGKDGMDCSLLVFDFENNSINYSAANNPIWLVRNNELQEFSPDKMPVGKHDKDNISFTQKIIELQKGDMIYTLTDGFPDQFGGPKGKKYMYKHLKETLVKISHSSTSEQLNNIENELESWKGNSEQVDDITLIGIRI